MSTSYSSCDSSYDSSCSSVDGSSSSSSNDGKPQIHLLIDDSTSTNKEMFTLDPATFAACKDFYTKITGKKSRNVTRQMFMLWHVDQTAHDAVEMDWDGLLTVHLLSSGKRIDIPNDGNFRKELHKEFKRLFKKRSRGSNATDDFEEIVERFMGENNKYGVFFYTDGSITDQRQFRKSYEELAPAIVEHAGNDEDFGVVVLVASDKCDKKLKKLKEKFDDALPDGTDLFDAADLRKTPTDVSVLLHMAAHG